MSLDMTPAIATTNPLNVFTGDSKSSGERSRAIIAGTYLKNLFLGEFMHPVEFATDPSRFETTSPLAVSDVAGSCDPFEILDSVVVASGVDVIDFMPSRGQPEKRYRYESMEKKPFVSAITQIRTQVAIPSRRLFHQSSRSRTMSSNVTPEFSISGNGVNPFVPNDRHPVGVFHG